MSQAGLIDAAKANPDIPTSFITDSGTAVASSNEIEILGAGTASTAGSGNTITVTSSAGFSVNLTNVTSTPYVVLSTDEYLSVNMSTVKTIQLPDSPSTGRFFAIKDRTGQATSNNMTITTVGGVVEIDGSTTYVINQDYGSVLLMFNGTSYEVF
jgi:hypothetical protein